MALTRFRGQILLAVAALGLAGGAMLTVGANGPVASLAGRVIRADAAAVLEKVAVPADSSKVEALEITVRPDVVSNSGSLLLKIELLDHADLAAQDPRSPAIATGTVGFFPAAKVGVTQSFVIPIPVEQRARVTPGRQLSARVAVRPANPQNLLGETAIELVDARLR